MSLESSRLTDGTIANVSDTLFYNVLVGNSCSSTDSSNLLLWSLKSVPPAVYIVASTTLDVLENCGFIVSALEYSGVTSLQVFKASTSQPLLAVTADVSIEVSKYTVGTSTVAIENILTVGQLSSTVYTESSLAFFDETFSTKYTPSR